MPTRLNSLTALLISLTALLLFTAGAAAAPANDNFGDATTAATRTGLNVNFEDATSEAGEPDAADGDHTLWYSWEAPSDGYLRVSNCNSPITPVIPGAWIDVYSGGSLNSLSSLESASGGCPSDYDGVTTANVPVTGGQTYRIQIGAPAAYATPGEWVYWVDFNTAVPANDDWANAADLSPTLPQTVVADNGLATQETADPDYVVGNWTNTVWYRWTPDRDGTVSLDLCDSDYGGESDSQLELYSAGDDPATLAGLVPVNANDDGCGATTSLLSRLYAKVTSGSTYWIRVANYSQWRGFVYQLKMHWVDTLETSVAPYLRNPDTHRVGQSLSASVGAWGSPALDDLTLTTRWLRCGADGGDCEWISGETGTDYTLTADDIGHTIRFEVYADDGITSMLAQTPASLLVDSYPDNDEIANATDLGNGTEVYQHDDANFATVQPNETSALGDPAQHTVWYRWTAPTTGGYAIGTCADAPNNDTLDLGVAVYTGDGTIEGSTSAMSADDGCDGGDRARGALDATAGTEYWIQVDSAADFDTAFTLSITQADKPFFSGNASLSGSEVAGATLHATPGTSVSALAAETHFQWALCDANGDNCDNSGTDSANYLVAPTAVAGRVKVTITMTNYFGSTSQDALSGVIQADDDGDGIGDTDDVCPGEEGTSPPGNGCQPSQIIKDQSPSISGTRQVGAHLTSDPGTWHTLHNPLAIEFDYQWVRCASVSRTGCTNIGGATSPNYTTTGEDLGKFIFLNVVAHNADTARSGGSPGFGPINAASGGASTDPFPQPTLPKSLGTAKASKPGELTLSKLKLTCGASATGACSGRLTITSKKTKTVKAASQTFKLSSPPGAGVQNEYKLGGKLLKALKKAKKLKATVKLVFGGPGFAQKTASYSVTLKI